MDGNRQKAAGIAPVRIEAAKAMRFVGLEERFTPARMAEIPALWSRFEASGVLSGVAYGVVRFGAGEEFTYLAAVERATDAPPPEGFVEVLVPARSYVVYVHEGHVARLCDTIAQIEVCAGLNEDGFIERYGEGFDPRTGLGDMEVWVPLRE